MNWNMDFDKTSFSVDWFTPGDKYAPKRLSFPKSARISIDDFVSDSPSGFCFSPVGEVVPKPGSYSFVDTPFERASGWTNSAPPSPFFPPDHEPYLMYDPDAKTCAESLTDGRALASPGLLSIVHECASCGVEVDVSCLDDLDEQLLLSPIECFTELCWAAAVDDEATPPPPVMHKSMRSRARSFKDDVERAFSPPSLARDYPGSFERLRPLAAKITLPLEPFPHARWSPFSESHDTLSTFQEKPLAYILYTDPDGRPLHTHGSLDVPRRLEKRGRLTVTPSFESLAPASPPSPHLRSSKSSQALRVISDACATFARARRTSPH